MKPKLKELLDLVNKGAPGTMMVASEAQSARITRVPTGIFAVDVAIGGGLPKGRTFLLVGDESAGKSTLCLYITATWQKTCRDCLTPFVIETVPTVHKKTGEVTGEKRVVTKACTCGKNEPHLVAYYDAEGTFDEVWAHRIGVDTSELLLIQPQGAEEGIDIVSKSLRTGELDLIIIDSIAMMTPRAEIENSAESMQVGVMARAVNKAMRVWQAAINSLGMSTVNKPAIVLVNQFREKVGVMYGDPTTWPGGRGQNYAASIMLSLRSGKRIDRLGNVGGKDPIKVGVEVRFANEKNKTSTPYQRGTFTLFTQDAPNLGVRAGEVDNANQVIEYGERIGVLEKKGAWYDLQTTFGKSFANPDSKSGNFQGLEAVKTFLLANPEQAQVVKTAILSAGGTGTLPATTEAA